MTMISRISKKPAVVFLAAVLLSLVLQAQVTVDIKLSPAGSFKAKTSEIKGHVVKKEGKYEAQEISVDLRSLKTGIALRDEHTQKHLETAKFPEANLIMALGENGKGRGKIKIRGIEKEIEGSYVEQGGKLKAEFPLKVSDFNITGIRYMGVGMKDDIKVEVLVPIK
jgi:polyisoprenoid-binding protein YceI